MAGVKNSKNVLTVSEIAEEAGVSAQTIKRWAKAKKIPQPKKLVASGRVVFSVEDLPAILKFATDTVDIKH